MAEFDWYPSEKSYEDPSQAGMLLKFPSIDEQPSVELSVIVPAYNEESRLPSMMDECLDYLESRAKNDPKFTYEVIVVSDGSSDDTGKVALSYSKKYSTERVRLLKLERNRGKGGAVRIGSLSARGKFILFADADGATRFSDVEKLQSAVKDNFDSSDAIAVGEIRLFRIFSDEYHSKPGKF